MINYLLLLTKTKNNHAMSHTSNLWLTIKKGERKFKKTGTILKRECYEECIFLQFPRDYYIN